jgi:ribosomal protein L37AE/L43A
MSYRRGIVLSSKWKSRKAYCPKCGIVTVHAYDNNSFKGILSKIFICRSCEYTTINHHYKKKKFVVNVNDYFKI